MTYRHDERCRKMLCCPWPGGKAYNIGKMGGECRSCGWGSEAVFICGRRSVKGRELTPLVTRRNKAGTPSP
jgi:hypothetical protein